MTTKGRMRKSALVSIAVLEQLCGRSLPERHTPARPTAAPEFISVLIIFTRTATKILVARPSRSYDSGLFPAKSMAYGSGWGTRTRTLNDGTKNRCVTITPSPKDGSPGRDGSAGRRKAVAIAQAHGACNTLRPAEMKHGGALAGPARLAYKPRLRRCGV